MRWLWQREHNKTLVIEANAVAFLFFATCDPPFVLATRVR